MERMQSLEKLNKKIITCKKCPRLAYYIQKVAKIKIKRFNDQKYWGKPLCGFGDSKAQLMIIGLAPAAHGGNRTGRMFTGDSSGEWVAKVLYQHGFATKPISESVNDGFSLINAYITAALRCAPPQNKPQKEELQNCSQYLKWEFLILKNIKVIVCLGKIAFDSCTNLLNIKGIKFGHGKLYYHEGLVIMCSFHPSRQNTQTRRLTWDMWSSIFSKAKNILEEMK